MKLKLAVLAAGSFLILASCDAFFTTNLFKEAGLGQVKLPSAAELASMSTEELLSEADSPEFYDQLEADSDKLAAVLGNLSVQMSSPDPATRQEAAFLYAQVQLKTTDAFEAVKGIFKAAATVDLASVDASNIADLVQAALPAEVLADETRFKNAVVALLNTNAVAYAPLGSSIGISGCVLSKDEIGNVAQGALVAAALAGVPGATDDAKAAALWGALSSGTVAGYTAPVIAAGSPLDNILGAAGITFTFN